MSLKRYLYVAFFVLSFLSITYLICATDLSYAYPASSGIGLSAEIYHSKKPITIQNRSALKNSIFYALFSSSSEHLQQIQSICGIECQNIFTNIFDSTGNFGATFMLIFLLYIFLQKLLIFPINHPPKFLSV